MRNSIQDFSLANPIYVGATVTIWTVSAGVKTATKATLYAGATGTATLANPQSLDSDGKFQQPVYIDDPVIMTVSGLSIADHDTGIVQSVLAAGQLSSVYEDLAADDGVLLVGNAADKRDLASTASGKGAAMVGIEGIGDFFPGSVTQVEQALQMLGSSHVLSVKDPRFGAAGDGIADDTAEIQAALTAAAGFSELIFPPGAYVIGPVDVPSNSVLRFAPGVTLRAKTGLVDGQRLVNLNGVSNVVIFGNQGIVEMLKDEYTSGEQRHGVFIFDSHNVTVYNLFSNDSGGDGIYVGGTDWSSNVNLINCGGDNNRRQGLSVVSCDGFLDFCGTWTNTNGTLPECGIDIEPNSSANRVRNIRIIRPRTSGNAGSGVLVAVSPIAATAEASVSIDISGHHSISDGANSGNPAAARFVTSNLATLPYKINGRISYHDFTIEDPDKAGVAVYYWDSTKAPFLDIHDGSVTNAGFSAPAANRDKSGINVFGGTGSLVTSIGNFRLSNIKISDSRGTVGTYTGTYLEGSASAFANYEIIDVVPEGFVPTSGSYIVQLGNQTNSLIRYSRENKLSVTGNATVTHHSGRTIVPTNSGVYTLPAAASVLGQEFMFRQETATTGQIRPAAGDAILQYGLAVSTDLIMNAAGDFVKLRAVAANAWQVEAITEKAKRPAGYTAPGVVVWSTAAPTANTWTRGDRCINSQPSVGQPKAWSCTVAGTPGTWVSEGNL